MARLAPLFETLDPRADPSPPIEGAVSIPAAEIMRRVHELPSQRTPVLVADVGDGSSIAMSWLKDGGREAALSSDWRYANEAQWGRLWQPNAFLEEVLPHLLPSGALDLACGCGREAVAMAGAGFAVTAYDHLAEALELGKGLESRYLEDSQAIDWRCEDVEANGFGVKGKFGLVTMFFFLHRPLISRALEWLEPGGSLVVETFTERHRELFGKPRRQALAFAEGELRELAVGLHVRSYEEGLHGGRHTARLWAVRE